MEVDPQFIDIETVIPYTPFLKKGVPRLVPKVHRAQKIHYTHTHRSHFIKGSLYEVKAQGYAIDHVDQEPELKPFAAPVKDH